MTTLVSRPPVTSSSLLLFASIQSSLVSLSASAMSMNVPDPKKVEVFTTPLAEPDLLIFVPNFLPFQKPVDMLNTSVLFVVVLSSSFSTPLSSYVGSSCPLMKQKVEGGSSNNGGYKRILPSLKRGPTLTCSNQSQLRLSSSPLSNHSVRLNVNLRHNFPFLLRYNMAVQ